MQDKNLKNLEGVKEHMGKSNIIKELNELVSLANDEIDNKTINEEKLNEFADSRFCGIEVTDDI